MLQTAYLKVLDGSARFDGRSSAKTWLFAVIRRTAAERRRRQWLRDLVPVRVMQFGAGPPEVPPPDSLVELSEANARLRAALMKLPRRQRELLHLVFYEDLTVEEGAAVLGVSVGSARTHYHRGKAGLRELLAGKPT